MESRKKVHISRHCGTLYLKLPPAEVGMFRFLLEARDNLAMFTVLDRKLALLKILFAPESRETVNRALREIGQAIPLEILNLPDPHRGC